MTDKAVDEAVERVKAYVASWDGFDDGTIISDELGPNPLTLGDLRALLSALELGRHLAKDALPGGETHPAARLHVDEAMVERALHARVPGGSEVWCWLPQKDAWTPHQTARDVMECALSAALNASQAHVKHKAEGGCEPPPAPSDRGRG